MTLQWILVYRQPARTRVVRNFAIGGTSRPERRGVRVGGVTFWACHINGGGNFLKYPLPGRGKFSICLNCLKITDPLDSFVVWQNKRISSLLFLLLGLTQRGACAAVTSAPITDARMWLLLLCDLFYPSGDVEVRPYTSNQSQSE